MHWLYITKATALAAGLTHYGTLYGVPAWFAGDDDETLMCTPKMPVLHVWCRLADYAFEVASWFMPNGAVLVSPIYVHGEIE